jgi:aryl-alcohol dehydrogenase-like predicted oxidoreductase
VHRTLGQTNINVFPIGLGAMPLSIQKRPDREQAKAVLGTALDAGVNFIDTANAYCLDDGDIGHNERLIADVLREKPLPCVIVATKGGCIRPGGRWGVDARPERLRAACEMSLAALQAEAIDLYQLHAPDPQVPFADSVGELARLREGGKVKHVGLSNVTENELNRAQDIVPITSIQNRCNPFYKRDLNNGLIDYCAKQGVSYIAYSPLGGSRQYLSLQRIPLFQDIARQLATSVFCVALSWLLHLGEHVLPIPGASRPGSILDSVQASALSLTPQAIEELNQLPDF